MMRRLTVYLSVIIGIGLLSGDLSYPQTTRKFRSDDPLKTDPDQLPVPQPNSRKISQTFDFLENTFAHRPEEEKDDDDDGIVAAVNVNTLGEVPDSSWFINRMGRRTMTIEELTTGPNQGQGPDRTRPWLIMGVKAQGITPGFTIRDGRGDTYFIKFDPPRYPQLATSTEVIATKFFHAFGYTVPQNYLSTVYQSDLTISPDARLEDKDGKERPVLDSDIDDVFDRAYQLPDGGTPVIASKKLSGIPIGPFKYFGTRSDDANDIFPHQNRRELRGLREFSAWLNHDDSRSVNSLDIYLGEAGKGYVQHCLIDFGSCLGSGSIRLQSRRAGNEYMFEANPGLKSAFTLGIWDRPWRHVKYPDYPAVGRFESDFFQPHLWKPEYPNPAFDRMQVQDAFWATRIVAQFSDEMVRAIVQTGNIADPEAEEYLIETLIERRDKIVAHYLSQLNPLHNFRLAGSRDSLRLEFENLGLEAGLGSVNSYRYQWFRFDNESQSLELLGQAATSTEPHLSIPRVQAICLMVQISTHSATQPEWKKKVEVFIRNSSEKPTIVGIERES